MYFDDLKIGMAVDTAPGSDYFCHPSPRKRPEKKVGFVFEKVQEFRNLLWSKHLRAYLPSRSDAHNGNLQRRGIKAKPVTVKQLQAFSCKINL